MRKTLLLLPLLLIGCGVPKSQHDAALADLAAKNKTECEAQIAARQK